MKIEEVVHKDLFVSYTREKAYNYLRSKEFKRRAGITKKRPYLLIQPLPNRSAFLFTPEPESHGKKPLFGAGIQSILRPSK
jgi:hypothetical protein